MVMVVVTMEKVLSYMVDFVLAFFRTFRRLHRHATQQEPVDMDVDMANLNADDPPPNVPREDVTEIMEELARLNQELARLQRELTHARGHQERLQGERDVAEDLLRGLNVEYEQCTAELERLRIGIRRHNEVCPNGGPIYMSRHGRRWHRTRGCEHLAHSQWNVVELGQCLTCTGDRLGV